MGGEPLNRPFGGRIRGPIMGSPLHRSAIFCTGSDRASVEAGPERWLALLLRPGERLAGFSVRLVGGDIAPPLLAGQVPINRAADLGREESKVQIPQDHRLVRTRRGQPLPVWAEGDALDLGLVPLQG